LAYSLATAIFGGFTPAICTWLIQETSNRAIPGAWLSFAAAMGLMGAIGAKTIQAEIEPQGGAACMLTKTPVVRLPES
jgi:hypothetical protein